MDDKIGNEYFEWLYSLVYDDSFARGLSYRKLFEHMYMTEFYWLIDHDENRVYDGLELRHIFADDYHYSHDDIDYIFSDKPCSVLEVMIGMCMRCERSIAEDEDYGDRTGQWFWTMIVNMGLGDMNDRKYKPNRVQKILNIFLNREYENNQVGCPFYIQHPKKPLRETELWMQINWYLSEIL